MKPDEELVREAQGGSRDAFAEIVRRHEATLISIARARLRDPEAAHEVAQQAVVKAFFSIRTLREPAKLRAWLGRLVLNLCVDERRRSARPEPSVPAPRPTGIDEDLLAPLEPLQRMLLALRFVNEFSYEEAAEWLGLPVNKVKWELHRAFETLRQRARREA